MRRCSRLLAEARPRRAAQTGGLLPLVLLGTALLQLAGVLGASGGHGEATAGWPGPAPARHGLSKVIEPGLERVLGQPTNLVRWLR